MRGVLRSAARQAVIIIVAVVLIALAFNALRKDGIPLVADAEAFRVRTDAEFLKVTDAERQFEEGNAIFVDARAPQAFAVGHIEGALNVPPTGPELERAGWLSGAGSSVICYASEKNQRQAGVVADKLIEMGTEKVFVLYGGLEAWVAAGLPIEKD
jgi:rhodanese-related sulfurtransferase